MIEKLIKDSISYFPLIVDSIIWDHTTLRLTGMGWDFSTTCSWRIVIDRVLDYAWYDNEVTAALKKFE